MDSSSYYTTRERPNRFGGVRLLPLLPRRPAHSTITVQRGCWSVDAQRDDCMRRDRFASADCIDSFVGLRFEINFARSDAERLSQRRTHRGKMRAEFRPLANDYCIDIHDTEATVRQKPANMLQKNQARCPFPLRVGVGKVCANVTEAGCAQQRVSNRVTQHVAVRVPLRTFLEWHLDAANHQLPSFDERMQVVADSGVIHALAPRRS